GGLPRPLRARPPEEPSTLLRVPPFGGPPASDLSMKSRATAAYSLHRPSGGGDSEGRWFTTGPQEAAATGATRPDGAPPHAPGASRPTDTVGSAATSKENGREGADQVPARASRHRLRWRDHPGDRQELPARGRRPRGEAAPSEADRGEGRGRHAH